MTHRLQLPEIPESMGRMQTESLKMTTNLAIGFGKACITPTLPCRLAGFMRRTEPSYTVAQDLWARSIVMRTDTTCIAWVICDLLEVDRGLVNEVRLILRNVEHLNVDHVMVGATHTHSGPDIGSSWALSADLEDTDRSRVYRRNLPYAIASSVVSASQQMANTSLSWSEIEVNNVGSLRRSGDRGTQSLRVLTVDTESHRPLGVVAVYACHPTVLGPTNLAVSGDLFGATVGLLEEKLGPSVHCILAQGAAGDVSTRFTRVERTEQEVLRLAHILADRIVEALHNSLPVPTSTVTLSRRSVKLPIKPQDTLPDLDIGSITASRSRAEADRSIAALREEAEFMRRVQPCTEQPAELCCLAMGNLRLCFVPGEPFQVVDKALQSAVPDLTTAVVGYTNGASGYIFGEEDVLLGGYEVLASPLTSEACSVIVGTLKALAYY